MVAGEASADKHASAVIRALRVLADDLEVFGMGGPEMKAAGMECIYGADELSVMGFSDVLPRVRHIHSVFKGLLGAIRERRPHVVVPVDLPDFNMRLAKKARRSGFKVLYYIAPQAWAWRGYRASTLAGITDGLAVIFPFEQEFFSSRGVNARYVGHPFMEDASTGAQRAASWPPGDVLLMPGSRRHEIETILPLMNEARRLVQKRHPGLSWHLRMAPGLDREIFEALADPGIDLTHELPGADLAVVKSGTSSFEMAVRGVPEVICYRTSRLNYRLAKTFVTVGRIGMPNIILGADAVPELIQENFTPESLAAEICGLVEEEKRFVRMQAEFARLRDLLGHSSPSEEVAKWITTLAS